MKLKLSSLLILFSMAAGCASLMGLESAKPNEEQIAANVQIADTATRGMTQVYEAKLEAMETAGKEITKQNVASATEAFKAAVDGIKDPKARANMFANYGQLMSNLTEEKGVVENLADVNSIQENIGDVAEVSVKATKTDRVLYGMRTAGNVAGFVAGKEEFIQLGGWFADKLPLLIGGGVPSVAAIATFVTLFLKSRGKTKRQTEVIKTKEDVIRTAGKVIASKGGKKVKASLAKAMAFKPVSAEGLL